jgi:hypothetical protein
MRALTLWPENAHCVAHLGKVIENRKGKPWASLMAKRERIAIHAGAYIGGRKGRPAGDEGMHALIEACEAAGVQLSYWSLYERRAWLLNDGSRPIVCSAIVCTAVLARCEKNEGQDPPPWADPSSPYWWHLADVEVLPEPIPHKGAQGFWKWKR